MNLIQIKQIDGLTTTLNSLAKGLFDLEIEITGQLDHMQRIYDVADVVNSGESSMLDVFVEGDLDVETNWGSGVYNDISFRVSDGYGLFDYGLYTNYIEAENVNFPNADIGSVTSDSIGIRNVFGQVQDVGSLFNKNYLRLGAGTSFPYILGYNDSFVSIDNSAIAGGSMNQIILPQGQEDGSEVIIKCEGTGLSEHIHGAVKHSFIVTPQIPDKIDGGSLFHITGDYQSSHFVKHNSGWGLVYSNYGTIEGSGEVPVPVLPSDLESLRTCCSSNASGIYENFNLISSNAAIIQELNTGDNTITVDGGTP